MVIQYVWYCIELDVFVIQHIFEMQLTNSEGKLSRSHHIRFEWDNETFWKAAEQLAHTDLDPMDYYSFNPMGRL